MKKYTEAVPYETAEAVESVNEPASGYVVITKVIREYHDLKIRREYGDTIGQNVDRIIQEAIDNGQEIQSFEIEFVPEQWMEMCRLGQRRK